jgi:2-dehydropantoate 2-reductase
MKVCIVGAGAIGGWIGTRLAASAGAEISAVARGASLAALTEHGWRLRSGDSVIQAPAHASDDATTLGPQDVVIIAVKAPALPGVVASVVPLLGEQTIVVPFMNGVPWWFGHGTVLGDEPLESIDPGGTISAAIPVDQVLGGVVHAGCMTPEPGVVRHMMGNQLILGEPTGGASERAERVGELLRAGGFDVTVSANIRSDLWYKLWGNMTMNPVSAMTGATLEDVLDDPLVREFCSGAMLEAAVIGERLGLPIRETPEDRHAVTAKLGAFKTSMLQDVEAGRRIELDALVGAVYEIGARLGEPTPSIAALFGLTRLFARTRGLY